MNTMGTVRLALRSGVTAGVETAKTTSGSRATSSSVMAKAIITGGCRRLAPDGPLKPWKYCGVFGIYTGRCKIQKQPKSHR
jgi:hypothetical protein